MKVSKSKNINLNYAAKIVKLSNERKHSNADRLKIFVIDFQNIITDLSYKNDDIVIYFPVECKININFISFINGFSDSNLNKDKTIKGFFNNKNARVKAIRLRGERSQGFIVKLEDIERFFNSKIEYELNEEFDMIGSTIICEKYILERNNQSNLKSNNKINKRVSRIIDNQFRFHNDTANLRRNIDNINPYHLIGIHYKKHGTSLVVANVLVKKKLNWFNLILKYIGINIKDVEYDIVISSRKVIKNEYEEKKHEHYYGSDIWSEAAKRIKEYIPKGFTLYCEILGFTPSGEPIQDQFDYGCNQNEFKIYVYRITFTNVDGIVIELDDYQIQEYCSKYNLNYSDTFLYYGYAKDLYPELNTEQHWRENFIANLERDYNNKNCWMCKNNVPEEGIILRKMNLFDYEAYKLKSANFLEFETKQLDNNICDMEEQ